MDIQPPKQTKNVAVFDLDDTLVWSLMWNMLAYAAFNQKAVDIICDALPADKVNALAEECAKELKSAIAGNYNFRRVKSTATDRVITAYEHGIYQRMHDQLNLEGIENPKDKLSIVMEAANQHGRMTQSDTVHDPYLAFRNLVIRRFTERFLPESEEKPIEDRIFAHFRPAIAAFAEVYNDGFSHYADTDKLVDYLVRRVSVDQTRAQFIPGYKAHEESSEEVRAKLEALIRDTKTGGREYGQGLAFYNSAAEALHGLQEKGVKVIIYSDAREAHLRNTLGHLEAAYQKKFGKSLCENIALIACHPDVEAVYEKDTLMGRRAGLHPKDRFGKTDAVWMAYNMTFPAKSPMKQDRTLNGDAFMDSIPLLHVPLAALKPLPNFVQILLRSLFGPDKMEGVKPVYIGNSHSSDYTSAFPKDGGGVDYVHFAQAFDSKNDPLMPLILWINDCNGGLAPQDVARKDRVKALLGPMRDNAKRVHHVSHLEQVLELYDWQPTPATREKDQVIALAERHPIQKLTEATRGFGI